MRKSSPFKPSSQNTQGASFRDPAGFVFTDDKGDILRQINPIGKQDFELMMSSGLYDDLVQKGRLVPHARLKKAPKDAYAVIKPERVPFISYPFEWSFTQLKHAALLTLAIQKSAIERGMTMKDASAYNVQFMAGRPVFIDTLSFEAYQPGSPWQAYRQFCQHFLAPLALMSYTDLQLSQLSRVYLDGVPLDLASRLLPRKAKLRQGIMLHVVMHGRAQKSKADDQKRSQRTLSKAGHLAILDSLYRTIKKLEPKKSQTEWGDYYNNTNYAPAAADDKAKLVHEYAATLTAKTALDLGGNDGRYSRVLNNLGIFTICSDVDPIAVEMNYRNMRQNKEKLMLPLLIDLVNPGGLIGWNNQERASIFSRFRCDVVMTLAIVHHLAISNNLPLSMIAETLSRFGDQLIIEFVPKTDSQVKKLLATREDIFPDYTEEGFEEAFSKYFGLVDKKTVKGTKRTLYLYKAKKT